MKLYFVTSNKGKFLEAKVFFLQIEQLDIDLPEIQSLDSKEIIKTKLLEALKHQKGEFIVEDISLCLDCLHGLPGPLIKWFLKTLGNEGLVQVAEKLGNVMAEAKIVLGYARSPEKICYFEGAIAGKIVTPRGDKGFGWDPIFLPDGYRKTFAEMEPEEKNKISMRGIALKKLKTYLEEKDALEAIRIYEKEKKGRET